MKEHLIYPSFSGITTFLRSPYIGIENIKEGDIAIIGIPFDTTLGTRPGARYAPRSIREESVHFIYHLGAIDKEIINVSTCEKIKFPPKDIIYDVGDLRIYPSNVAKTSDSIVNGISEIVKRGAIPVIMGGDHYITYPAVKGFEQGIFKRYGSNKKIGYIHFDSHLDLYDENDTWGKYYHGSTARRVSELESVAPNNMVFVGTNGFTGVESWKFAKDSGMTIFTGDDIKKDGITNIMKKAAKIAGEGCTTIYLTIDIDVVDQAYASGTGSYIYGGITAVQLLEAIDAIREFNIGGIDIVEVAPNLDLSGNTSRLAATTLIKFLTPKIFEMEPKDSL